MIYSFLSPEINIYISIQ